jgi:hypothetical protein
MIRLLRKDCQKYDCYSIALIRLLDYFNFDFMFELFQLAVDAIKF